MSCRWWTASTQGYWFQSTSSEEDVVSCHILDIFLCLYCFNPRPPKRTLCLTKENKKHVKPAFQSTSSEEDVVSCITKYPKHTCTFQSTSSEEDVVSYCHACRSGYHSVSIHVLRRGRCVGGSCNHLGSLVLFQSTSSEEDVVSRLHDAE